MCLRFRLPTNMASRWDAGSHGDIVFTPYRLYRRETHVLNMQTCYQRGYAFLSRRDNMFVARASISATPRRGGMLTATCVSNENVIMNTSNGMWH